MLRLVALVAVAVVSVACNVPPDGTGLPGEGEGEGEGEGVTADTIGECDVGCQAGGGQLGAVWTAGLCDDDDDGNNDGHACLTPKTCEECRQESLDRANECNQPGIAEPGIVCSDG